MSIQIQMLKINDITIEFEKINNFEKKLIITLAYAYKKYRKTIDDVARKVSLYASEEEACKYWFMAKFDDALKELKLKLSFDDIDLKITHSEKDSISGFILYDNYVYQFMIFGNNKFSIRLTKYKYQNELKAYNE